MKAFHRIKEGEFVRLLQTRSIHKIIAQESQEEPLKFFVVAINTETQIAYTMRHGREDKHRAWRIDNLTRFLKSHCNLSFEVQYQVNAVQ